MTRAVFPVVAHVLLRRRIDTLDELYLQRRSGTDLLNGWFVPPGGHLEAGELPMAAACRELAEETGVRCPVLNPLAVLPYATGRGAGINFVFSLDAAFLRSSEQPVIAEPALADLGVWAPVQRLPSPCPGWVARALALDRTADWYAEVC